jgi:sialic acid synthase SpsE
MIEIGRPIGAGHPPFMVAALDGVQLGSLERVLAAIDVAADSHCDAVKLTTLPWSWCAKSFLHAERRGLAPLARAVDETAIARLDWCGAPAFALQFDWSDLDLIACAARTGKPLFVSVGRATDLELEEVVATATANGSGGIALLQPSGAGLDRIEALLQRHAIVGVTDHTRCPDTARAAVSRGASIVVKKLFELPGAGELASVVRSCEQEWARGNTGTWTTN